MSRPFVRDAARRNVLIQRLQVSGHFSEAEVNLAHGGRAERHLSNVVKSVRLIDLHSTTRFVPELDHPVLGVHLDRMLDGEKETPASIVDETSRRKRNRVS